MRSLLLRLTKLERNPITYVFAFILVLFILLRIPSLVEPSWYGDEGIYQTIGFAISEGELLYRDVWDNKPPLIYLLYAFFNGDLFPVKFLSLLFGIGAISVFFLLCKSLFQSVKASVTATFFFALLLGLPFLEGNIANAENFMLFPTLLAFYLILDRKKYFFLAGVLFSLSFLLKAVALFDIAALFFILYLLKKDEIHEALKNRRATETIQQKMKIFAGFLVPFLLFSLYFLFSGIFVDYLRSVFLQNLSYVGYENYFIFPNGLLVLKVFLLLLSLVLLLIFRTRLHGTSLVIYGWLLFAVFNAFFSHRPYTHYILVALPALCLVLGLAIDSVKMRFIALVTVVGLVILFNRFFPYYKKNTAYYQNYIDYIQNRKSVEEYQSFFDSITPRDYRLADFIKEFTEPNEEVLLWTNSAQIYYLSHKVPPIRYIASYHISPVESRTKEVLSTIEKNNYRYIIVTESTFDTAVLQNYDLRIMIDNAYIYERKL